MAFYTIEYAYDPARTQLMDEVRPQHRAFLGGLAQQGINLGSGPFVDADTPRALLIFSCDTAEDAEKLLNQDPFWLNKVIVRRTITQWNPVIGAIAQLEV